VLPLQEEREGRHHLPSAPVREKKKERQGSHYQTRVATIIACRGGIYRPPQGTVRASYVAGPFPTLASADCADG
jgi:hypothetical protein